MRVMTQGTTLTHVFGAAVTVCRVCRNSCGYCSFRDVESDLMPLEKLAAEFIGFAKAGAIQVSLVSGDSPHVYPSIQFALKRESCVAFSEYLRKGCALAVEAGLLPVVEAGALDPFDVQTVSEMAASVRFSLTAAGLHGKGEAHAEARNRGPEHAKGLIEQAHRSQLPYHLDFLIGIGETEAERHEFLRTVGTFCGADPWLQDVRLVPFQPIPGTAMSGRPPLGFEQVAAAMRVLREAFPVHFRAITPHLFSRFAELTGHGLNDLGPLPFLTGDPVMSGFPVPAYETLKSRLTEHNILLSERLPLTTPAAENRGSMTPTLAAARNRLLNRDQAKIKLIDDKHCFVCGHRNTQGLQITLQKNDPGTCSTVWTSGPAHQGYAGIVHGGILTTLLDEMMGHAIISTGILAVTAEMRIKFLRPAPIGFPLTVVGNRTGGRGRVHLAKGVVMLPDGTVLAEAEGRFVEC
ncbi:MAG: FO synthase subunit 1 [bacterium ADurb.Bin374]|nr:MAG: FO synthase subunit 1 [bacterium ADurb.Bin374]